MTPYQFFLEYCKKRKIDPDVKEGKYLELRDEYHEVWSETVKTCVDWLSDKGLKKANAMRLRNFAKKTKEYRKNEEFKRLEKNQREREVYHENKERVENEKRQEAIKKEREKRKIELDQTQEESNKTALENHRRSQIRIWCENNKVKAIEYLKTAEEMIVRENPAVLMLSESARMGLAKAKARILIRKNELMKLELSAQEHGKHVLNQITR